MMVPTKLSVIHVGQRPDDETDVLAIPLATDNWRHGVALPQEAYLREVRDLNLDDTWSLVEFTLAYGLLSRGLHQLPHFDEFSASVLSDPKKRHWPMEDHDKISGFAWNRYWAAVSLFGEDKNHWIDDVSPLEYAHELMRDENILFLPCEEIRVLLSLVRDMTTVWEMHTRDATIHWLQERWESGWLFTPTTKVHALWFLAEFLSAGLADFHVRLDFQASREGIPPLLTPPQSTTLYGALCLQLANHVTELATYRECKRCHRIFVRQQGRAEYGQHRLTGRVDYCSKTCAQTAAQAEYRKRKRTAREG